MNDQHNKAVTRSLKILDALAEDFGGLSTLDIVNATGIPYPTAWRLLKSMEAAEWVISSSHASGKTKECRWVISDRLVRIAYSYKHYHMEHRHAQERRFLDVTGEELRQ